MVTLSPLQITLIIELTFLSVAGAIVAFYFLRRHTQANKELSQLIVDKYKQFLEVLRSVLEQRKQRCESIVEKIESLPDNEQKHLLQFRDHMKESISVLERIVNEESNNFQKKNYSYEPFSIDIDIMENQAFSLFDSLCYLSHENVEQREDANTAKKSGDEAKELRQTLDQKETEFAKAIESLKKENEQLSQQTEELNASVSKSESGDEGVVARFELWNEISTNLSTQLPVAKIQTKISDVERKIRGLKSDKASSEDEQAANTIEREIAIAENERKFWTYKLSVFQVMNDLDEANKSIGKLEDSEANAETDTLKEFQRLEHDNALQRDTIRELKRRNGELTNTIHELELKDDALPMLKKQIKDERIKSLELQMQIDKFSDRSVYLEDSARELSLANDQLEFKVEKFNLIKESNTNNRKVIARLQEKVERLQAGLDPRLIAKFTTSDYGIGEALPESEAMLDDIVEVKERLKTKNERIIELRNEVDSLHDTIAERDNEIKQLENQLESLSQEYERMFDEK